MLTVRAQLPINIRIKMTIATEITDTSLWLTWILAYVVANKIPIIRMNKNTTAIPDKMSIITPSQAN
jgi:hypothetical protein